MQDQMTTTNNEGTGDTVNTTIATTTTTVVKTEEVAILDAVAEQVETLIAEFNNAKTAIKTLEDKKAEAEADLRELLGSAKKGTIEGIERLVVSPRSRSVIDAKMLDKAFPEASAACTKMTHFTVLTTK